MWPHFWQLASLHRFGSAEITGALSAGYVFFVLALDLGYS